MNSLPFEMFFRSVDYNPLAMNAKQYENDLHACEKIEFSVEVLSPEDPVFEPGNRPTVSEAIRGLIGEFGGEQVPFAAMALPQHKDVAEQNLYACLFGRDSLLIADLLSNRYPGLQLSAVKALGQVQGRVYDDFFEEEPGRIAHEVRDLNDPRGKEITALAGWKFPYYGSVDATLIWLRTASQLISKEPKLKDLIIDGLPLGKRAELSAEWILRRLDSETGFIESRRTRPQGILNQVWKDSGDSYQDASGKVALSEGTASVETVAETFDALMAASNIADLCNWSYSPETFSSTAANIRNRFLEKFFMDGFPAMGIQQLGLVTWKLDAKTSNQGRLLDSGLLLVGEHAELRANIAEAMVSDKMLGPNGVRTLGSDQPGYRPGGYHTGSSWPVDSAFVARGLTRAGFLEHAMEVAKRTRKAIEEIGGYPEMFRSDGRGQDSISRYVVDVSGSQIPGLNRVCQPPQLVQGWTVAAYSWLTTGPLSQLGYPNQVS